ncbi:helix-turn-helix transcriptional regulator [Acaricomes phytoseiuli]|uniref:helix-turn-helix domain-containing protein n=1 Tax=Acaricomes phytoseiuli TaxID=291968 RepID=UPI00039EBBCE|nr:helix-turn-helix transcriptional regulator [Acaricomes phytoseiuli]MCW1250638.1 helix-turn-helix transcriptional regulator [Acaricomes phytoseiuli]
MRLKSSVTLRALMQQEGLSLNQLAVRAGCSKGFISHLLSGRRTSCTPALAQRISRALGVPVTALFSLSTPLPEGFDPFAAVQRSTGSGPPRIPGRGPYGLPGRSAREPGRF